MPRNSYFKFKQFTIWQDQCAMKVCTDACTFGAWVPVENAQRILDIGAGTGLLSLMAAQRSPNALIHAVEIDGNAFEQANANVQESPFAERVQLFNQPVQTFEPRTKYDLIVSNPPFFQSDLRSPDQSVNVAHHAETLDFDALLESAERLLTPEGKFAVLLPVEESYIFLKLAAQNGWFLLSRLTLSHLENMKPFRHMLLLSRSEMQPEQPAEEVLYIHTSDGPDHHPDFKALLKDFYLKF